MFGVLCCYVIFFSLPFFFGGGRGRKRRVGEGGKEKEGRKTTGRLFFFFLIFDSPDPFTLTLTPPLTLRLLFFTPKQPLLCFLSYSPPTSREREIPHNPSSQQHLAGIVYLSPWNLFFFFPPSLFPSISTVSVRWKRNRIYPPFLLINQNFLLFTYLHLPSSYES